MSYAGVESEDEYRDRQRREHAAIVPYGEDPKAYRLRSARDQLRFHEQKVLELRAVIERLDESAVRSVCVSAGRLSERTQR